MKSHKNKILNRRLAESDRWLDKRLKYEALAAHKERMCVGGRY